MFDQIDLRGLSADKLESYSKEAAKLALALRQQQPSYELALLNGVRDKSYHTVRWPGCRI